MDLGGNSLMFDYSIYELYAQYTIFAFPTLLLIIMVMIAGYKIK